MLPFSGGRNVIAGDMYCGTTSLQSDVHYFANASDLERWTEYRGIRGFDGRPAEGGAIVVEMGQRMTSGYTIEPLPEDTHIDNDTLYLAVEWTAPEEYAAINQAMTAPCIVVAPPEGEYSHIVLVDQLGNTRGTAEIY